jgi:hypothetical protein
MITCWTTAIKEVTRMRNVQKNKAQLDLHGLESGVGSLESFTWRNSLKSQTTITQVFSRYEVPLITGPASSKWSATHSTGSEDVQMHLFPIGPAASGMDPATPAHEGLV